MSTCRENTARRTAIELCFQLGMTSDGTLKMMKSTDKFRNVSRQLIYQWHSRFSQGWTCEAPHGRPPYRDDSNILAVKNVINGDRRKTVREVAEEAGCSKFTVHRVLKNDLTMFSKWIKRHEKCIAHREEYFDKE